MEKICFDLSYFKDLYMFRQLKVCSQLKVLSLRHDLTPYPELTDWKVASAKLNQTFKSLAQKHRTKLNICK